MPRKYKATSNRFKWNMDDMRNAATAVRNGTSFRKACEQYSVPRGTLFRFVRKDTNTGQRGPRKTVLNAEEENDLAEHVLELQTLLYGVSTADIRKLAYDYVTKNDISHPFSKEKQRAGYDWLYGFLERHNELSIRTPEKTSISRMTAFNKVQVGKFFGLLKEVMLLHNFPPENIFNVDESGLSSVPTKQSKIVAKRGAKQVGIVTSAEKGETTTVVCCFNASGTTFVPPAMIFKRKNMTDQLLRSAPSGTIGMTSPNGWITDELFVKWLQHFADYTRPTKEKKVLLIMDNHHSHCSINAIEKAKSNNIILLTIPPHTSHKLQPLDKAFFSSLKFHYEKECKSFMVTHPGRRITQYDVSELFAASYAKSCTMEKARNGFRSCGIYPFNDEIFDDTDFAPSTVTEIEQLTISPIETTDIVTGK